MNARSLHKKLLRKSRGGSAVCYIQVLPKEENFHVTEWVELLWVRGWWRKDGTSLRYQSLSFDGENWIFQEKADLECEWDPVGTPLPPDVQLELDRLLEGERKRDLLSRSLLANSQGWIFPYCRISPYSRMINNTYPASLSLTWVVSRGEAKEFSSFLRKTLKSLQGSPLLVQGSIRVRMIS
jgi:hypothetical protein